MLRTKKFPKELDLVIDYSRIVWPAIREWTAKRVTELFGVEDEVLIQFIHNRLENTQELNPKELYLELVPFLEKNAGLFMKELWTLLASAAASSTGIPQQIMEAKAEELKLRKEQQALVRQTIELERKKVIAIQEEAKQAAKKNDNTKDKPLSNHPKDNTTRSSLDIEKRQKDNTIRSSLDVEKHRKHHRSRFSTLPKKRDDHYRHRRHRIASRRDRRVLRSPSRTRSISRSPPESRHGSPQPRASNLPLARKRRAHDKKSRSPVNMSRGNIDGRIEKTPTTKSPSPRSHNRMSITPYEREKTPSPPSGFSSKTPTPKPSTPQTQTPPSQVQPAPRGLTHDQRLASRSHGGSYRHDGSQVRRGYEERSPRNEYNSSRFSSHYRSHRHHDFGRRATYDNSRRGYAYRPTSPLRVSTHERPRRRHQTPSSSSFDESDKEKHMSSSMSANFGKQGDKSRHRKRKTKHDESDKKATVEEREPRVAPDSEETHSAKMKRKLSEILEKKDSLRLE
eukprot:g1435.t1